MKRNKKPKHNGMKKRTCTTVVLTFFIWLVLAHLCMWSFTSFRKECLVLRISSFLSHLRVLFFFLSNMRSTSRVVVEFQLQYQVQRIFCLYLVRRIFHFPSFPNVEFSPNETWIRSLRGIHIKMFDYLKSIIRNDFISTQCSDIVFRYIWVLSTLRSYVLCA